MNRKNQSFEVSMQRLEQIVRTMESGEISLEDSMKLFQEGTELVRSCEKKLNEAELQVKMITAGEDGRPIEENFENDL